jgi:hypothetical protein
MLHKPDEGLDQKGYNYKLAYRKKYVSSVANSKYDFAVVKSVARPPHIRASITLQLCILLSVHLV